MVFYMHKSKYILLGILLLSSYRFANAGIIFSTFGPANSYSTCCGFGNVAPTQMAYPFVLAAGPNFVFTGAALALSQGIGSTNSLDISLARDASGQPGAVLETLHLDNALGPAGSNNPPVTVTSLTGPLLLAGQEYWLVESPSAPGNGVNWLTANIVPNPPQRGVKNGTGPWIISAVDNSSNPGAFSISGNSAPVPEPSSITLLSVGLILLAARCVQRCRQRS